MRDKEMKIIILTSHYPYEKGENFINNEIQVLSKYFDEIIVICAAKHIESCIKYNIPNNMNVIIVNRYYSFYRSIFMALINMLSIISFKEVLFAVLKLKYTLNFSMVKKMFIYYAVCNRISYWVEKNIKYNDNNIVFYSYWLSAGAYALSKLKKRGYITKAISRAHGGDAFLDRGYNPFRREIYENLDQIHFVSEIALLQFKDKITLPLSSNKAKLFISYLGTLNKSNNLNTINKNNEYFTIVSCSNIIILKRLDLIVEALSNIENRNIKWVHFGDGIYKEVIFKLIAKQLSHLSNIEVDFKGQVNNDLILDFYEKQHVDIFINVSDCEGIPVSVMEAMSYGIPVIARNVGGNSEIVKTGYNGILLPKDTSSQEISRSILALIDLPEDCVNEYKKNAFETWKHKFDAETNYNAFAKNIKEMLA